MFLSLIKADAAQRMVWGRIDEAPDRVGEVMDYASSKANFEAWSAALAKATGGVSLGNIREMHQLSAVGVVKEIRFDDASRAIEIGAHVVDDEAWAKVEAGVYTGFSPGGRKRFLDQSRTRYTAFPSEISLVDLPCIPSAGFTMVKADGAEQLIQFAGDATDRLLDEISEAPSPQVLRGLVLSYGIEILAKAFGEEGDGAPELGETLAKRKFSAAERRKAAAAGDAMPDGSFPIEDRKDVEDAVEAIGRAKDPALAKAHIIKRAKALGCTDCLPADWEGSTRKAEDMKKGLGQVSRLAELLECLGWLASSVKAESAFEGDASPIPARIVAWVGEGTEILAALVTEETQEQLAALKDGLPDVDIELAAAAPTQDLAKRAMGRVVQLAAEKATLTENLTKALGLCDLLQKRVDQLEALPAPGGPRLIAVGKGNAEPVDDRAEALAKVHALPAETQEQQVAKATLLTRATLLNPGNATPKNPSSSEVKP